MRFIALEEHFTTQALRDANVEHPLVKAYHLLADRGHTTAGDHILSRLLDLGERRLADMDAAGIDIQVLSQTAPGPEDLPAEQAVPFSVEANDIVAEAISAHPDRFAGFATLPMVDAPAAAKELDRSIRDLGFVGALVNSHVNGRYLDDPFFWPVFEAAEDLNVPIYLHPNRPPQPVVDACYSGFSPLVTESLAVPGFGWHIDTGIHVLRLILAGVFDRFPNLTVILGHLGEALPSMISRANWMLSGISGLKKPVQDYFTDNFYVTTSGFFDHAPFAAAQIALGTDRILFSVDYPYSSNTEAREFFDHLPLSTPDKHKIAHGNSERLLGIDPAA